MSLVLPVRFVDLMLFQLILSVLVCCAVIPLSMVELMVQLSKIFCLCFFLSEIVGNKECK